MNRQTFIVSGPLANQMAFASPAQQQRVLIADAVHSLAQQVGKTAAMQYLYTLAAGLAREAK